MALVLDNNTVFPILSTVVLVLIALGLKYRKVNRLHIPLMLSAFAIDVGMVLWLEFNRMAVEKVMGGVSGLLLFHVVVSIGVVILYVALISTGLKLFKKVTLSPTLHRNLAIAFIIGRLINYVTSFFVGSA